MAKRGRGKKQEFAEQPIPQEPINDPLEGLDPFDKALLRLITQNPGITNRNLAKLIKADEHTVGKRRKNPDFVNAESWVMLPALEIFKRAQNEVASGVLDIYRRNKKGDPDIALKATAQILKPIVGEKIVHEGGDKAIQVDANLKFTGDEATDISEILRSGSNGKS